MRYLAGFDSCDKSLVNLFALIIDFMSFLGLMLVGANQVPKYVNQLY